MDIKALQNIEGRAELNDIPEPQPDENEVLIEVELAGICNTDLEVMAGMLDFEGVMGHEFVGFVREDSGGDLAGSRVVGEINIPCYTCRRCQKNQYNHCLDIKALGMRGKDGAFARYMTLPRENVHEVPEAVTDLEAVFTEPIAAAVQIAEQYHLRPSSGVMVIGDGKLGLIIARTLWAMGLEVEVIGRHREKLSTLSSFDIPVHLDSEYDTAGRDIPAVVEATGSTSGLETALELAAPEGRVIYKTTTAAEHKINLARLAIDEIELLGSRCGPFRPALRLLSRNNLKLSGLVTAEYPLSKGLEALELAAEKNSLKVLLRPDS